MKIDFPMSKRRIIITSIYLFCFCFLTYTKLNAQQRVISGTVADGTNKEPLPGVNVSVKGTTKGTVTGMDGEFLIENISEDDVLIISFIGYVSEHIPVKNRTDFNIELVSDIQSLTEIVVVGYGQKKKVNLTGAIGVVDKENFQNKGSINNPLQALQGTVGGITVTRKSGEPGRQGYDFDIRGITSINGTDPLVIIDGIPGNMDNMNPDDIESISFLKDASAAIYGARAAGGVVLITTKRGKSEKISVNYRASLDIMKPGLQMKYMGMQHYMEAYEESWVNDGVDPTGDLNIYPREVVNAYKTLDPDYMNSYFNSSYLPDIADYTFFDTDWNDVMYGLGYSQSHSLSLSGGSEKSHYMLSLGYLSDDGMLKWGNDGTKRYNVRLNYDFQVTDKIKLEASTAYENRSFVYPTQNYNPNLAQPGFPTSNINGDAYAWGGQFTPNWRAELGGDHEESINSFLLNLKLSIDLLKDLKLIGSASMNPSNKDRREWRNKIDWYTYEGEMNRTNPTTDEMYRRTDNYLYQSYTTYLEYSKTLNEAHKFSVMAGTSYETSFNKGFNVKVYNLINSGIHNLSMGSTETFPQIEERRSQWALGSAFGRVNYSFNDKYLLEGNFRYDGSSKFIANKRWRPFYGGSAGWNISREDFMQNLAFLSQLKLRASYGTLGNQNGIDNYDYIALVKINSPSGTINDKSGLFGPSDSPYVGQTITQDNVVSTERTWETIIMKNLGVDFAVLNNRLSGSFDVYQKKNSNMLIPVVYPAMFGAKAPATNSGTLVTNGWEFVLGWKNRNDKFGYYINASISDSKNELVQMEGANSPIPGYNMPEAANKWNVQPVEGYPLNSYFGYVRDGLISSPEELKEYMQMSGGILPTNLRVGDVKFKDLDGDGTITAKDIQYLGNNNVRYSYSFTLGGDYKGFDFMVYLQGVGKRDIYRETNQRAPFYAWWQGQNDALYGTYYSDLNERYGDLTYDSGPLAGQQVFTADKYNRKGEDLLPKLTQAEALIDYNYYPADWLLENGAYLRLKNVVIGYTVPSAITSKVSISKLRVYFSGTDLFEFQKIKDGWDPEAVRNPNENSERYPFARMYSFGLDLTF